MSGEIHYSDEEVVIESLDELLNCYRVLRGMARDSRNEMSFGLRYIQLDNLIRQMSTDINIGTLSLIDNMKATVSVSQKTLLLPDRTNAVIEFYLGEIQVLVDSYRKNGKDKENDQN